MIFYTKTCMNVCNLWERNYTSLFNTVDRLLSGDYTSTIRNKQIASVLKDAGIIERYGSGIKRILEWFSMYGLGQPVFEELQEGFRVTISRTTQKTTQKFSTKEHILRLLKENPRQSIISIMMRPQKVPFTGNCEFRNSGIVIYYR